MKVTNLTVTEEQVLYAFEGWEKLWKREQKEFNTMWVSEVSKRVTITKNEMEIEKPEGIVCKDEDKQRLFIKIDVSDPF